MKNINFTIGKEEDEQFIEDTKKKYDLKNLNNTMEKIIQLARERENENGE